MITKNTSKQHYMQRLNLQITDNHEMNREFDRRQKKKISVLNIFTNLKLRKFSDATKIGLQLQVYVCQLNL